MLAAPFAATLAAPAQAQRTTSRPDIAGDWFAQTVAAAGATGNEVSARRVWAIGWLSAQRALDTGHATPHQFQDAAVATAVHDVLVALVPARTDILDAARPLRWPRSRTATASGPAATPGGRPPARCESAMATASTSRR